MCLEKVLERYCPADPRVTSVWRVAHRDKSGALSPVFMRHKLISFIPGVWQQASSITVMYGTLDYEYYQTGFHGFTRQVDAIRYRERLNLNQLVICGGKFRNILARGLERGMLCIVASEQRIDKVLDESNS